MVELLQLLVGGIAQGCVYGLIALGFVLIYKATEMVNFAQGDLMMLGSFVALTFIGTMGMNYWMGLLVAAMAMAVFGYLLDAIVLRRIIGQPQFAVVILTISIGFLFRSFAGFIWGHETQNFPETPFTNRIINAGGVILSLEHLSIIAGTLILAGLLYLFFNYTRLGNAMQAASQNQLAAYYMGIPVKHINSLIWALSAIVATIAGVLFAPVSLVDPSNGFYGIKAFAAAVIGGFGSLLGTVLGGLIIGVSETLAARYLPPGFKEIVAYLIMLGVLIVRPHGLFSTLQRKEGLTGRRAAMRILFKTSYLDDIRLFQHSGQVFWYSVLVACLLLAPLVLGDFYVGELSYVFILAIAGVGLMLLIGFTGLVSLGHGAFMAIGAYTNTYLITKGVPFLIAFPVAGIAALLAGILVAVPANRMAGIYLAIATLAFSQIVEQIIIRWESVTRGFQGLPVPSPEILGHALARPWEFYYFCLAVLVLVVFAAVNLTRSPTGRAMVAIRDFEISAQSLGVNLVQYKTIAFAMSAGITGLAGALLAHKMRFISPDAFNILLSIQLLLMVVVGGLGSITGAILGAIFVGGLPQAIALMRDYLPAAIARTPGLEPGLFGLVMVAIVLFEPLGIYGRWLKIKAYFDYFPLYRRATFKRQRAYLKTERVR